MVQSLMRLLEGGQNRRLGAVETTCKLLSIVHKLGRARPVGRVVRARPAGRQVAGGASAVGGRGSQRRADASWT